MQSDNREPTIGDVLTELRFLGEKVDRLDTKVSEEVKRWDDRFFKFAEDASNRANTLIASATISVIVGMILLLIKQ